MRNSRKKTIKPKCVKKKMKNISEKIWRGMKKSVLLHSLNENKGVGKEAIFESNSIKLFVEKYKEDIKP